MRARDGGDGGENLLTRRDTLVLGVGATAAMVARPAIAQEEPERHGLSTFGDLKYPANFKHFDYINPDAPKGGIFSQLGPVAAFNQNFLTFNSLNTFILKGDAAQGMELTFAGLMTSGLDEPDALYGLAARAVRVSPDGLTYRFLMRPGTKFHDGTALTAHDVAFSLKILKEKGHPIIQQLMRDVIGVEAADDATVTVRFTPNRGRDVPLFVASLPIFSRAYYSTRPFDESTLDIPLGSGPYKVGRFEVGRFIEYDRVKDWWGANLPVSVGQNNFDTLRYEFYRDREAGFQAFTAKNYLFREEFTSRVWATRYDFPAFRDGRVTRDVLPDDTPSGAQGWFINTRREKFKNPDLREALNCAFDFEWTNKNIMYGSYERVHSMFQNSELMATGKPSADELALLEPFRGKVSDEVFGEPFIPPVSDGSGQDRALLRKAGALLQKAGFVVKDGKRVDASGQPVTIEFLVDEPSTEPYHGPFIKNLATLGIVATLRVVDAVQYKARVDQYDFDLTTLRLQMSSTPGDGLRSVFSSEMATSKGSRNLAGIADPVMDALIDKIIAANSRPELTTACRALDRVFRAGRYWVPQWHKPSHWVAYWDVFARPAGKPRYGRGAPDTWWYDADKAAKLEREG
ncbi:MAG: microcin transport system substrate-binding protein [Alphaproteobacteria bacterium]|jgi:microcin C transport system substrate-binding protein|nr:microcin transport system substrate-binding protein [Alphaproteobacteria bacterium]